MPDMPPCGIMATITLLECSYSAKGLFSCSTFLIRYSLKYCEGESPLMALNCLLK